MTSSAGPWLNRSFERIRKGRTFACSRPLSGFRSTFQTSPRAGDASATLLVGESVHQRGVEQLPLAQFLSPYRPI
jgi:hypothetical protein